MARPKKQIVDYYPHLAKSGKTIFILESRWGNDGYAFFHKLLETLCSTNGHLLDYGNPAEKAFFLAKTKLTDEIVTEMFDVLVELGKIDADLWQEKRVWYQQLIDNVKDAYKKRINELPQKPSLRNPKPVITEFPAEEIPINDDSGDGSTESKVNNIPPIVPLNGEEETPIEKGNELPEKPRIDCQGVLDEYNSICTKMPRAEKLTKERRSSIRSRLNDYSREDITLVFRYASQSAHHNGKNDQGWRADFDWLLGPKNFIKMLERAKSPAPLMGTGPPNSDLHKQALNAWTEVVKNLGSVTAVKWTDPDIGQAVKMLGGMNVIGTSAPGSMTNQFIAAFKAIKQRKDG